jgi:dCMP deaminase
MNIVRRNPWHEDFIRLAQFWADLRSKDPSTKVGAVIADVENQIVSIGYNGFPAGVLDHAELLDEKSEKYPRVVHAEANAILRAGERAVGANIYCTLFPCSECAKLIIQSGICEVYSPEPDFTRTGANYPVSLDMFKEAGLEVHYV